MELKDGYKLLHHGMLALARAERQGLYIDTNYAKQKRKELTAEIKERTAELQDSAFYRKWVASRDDDAVNLNSGPQLRKFLYDVLGKEPPEYTETGLGSVNAESLRTLQVPELDLMLRIRKLQKLRDTYLEGFIREAVDGRIHPFFNLHKVVSYRSSSDSPNFQNIPTRDKEARALIRQAIYPRPGHQLLELDYGALEVRIAACYHKDPTMLKYIRDGYDMHTDIAKQIFFCGKEFDKDVEPYKTLRGAAKNGFVFPQFYGDYYVDCAIVLSKWGELSLDRPWRKSSGIQMADGTQLGRHMRANGVLSMRAFEKHLKKIEDHFWNERFPKYQDWRRRWYRLYQKRGYFDLLTGFRCSGVMRRNEVVNYAVQGSAFHCLLWSFIELDRIMRAEGWRTRLVGQIHDSIVLDVYPPELDHVLKVARRVTCHDLLKAWPWIIVPLEIEAELADVDASWYEKKPISI